MNVLVINGSPKCEKSNTLKITNAFLRGLKSKTNVKIDIINCIEKNINPCKGCYSCWTSSPGRCIVSDDMEDIFNLYIAADIVIWSVPNYHFGIPSTAKAVLDRLLPIYLPLINERTDGGAGHPGRFDLHKQKYILISSCGFYSYQNNIEALEKQFQILYGNKCTCIFCLEGDLFNVTSLSFRTKEYLKSARRAGMEFAVSGQISEETRNRLCDIHYSPDTFLKLANNSWNVKDECASTYETECQKAIKLINLMCYVYLPEYLKVERAVLELYFYDLEQSYQIIYDKEKGTPIFNKSEFESYDLRIEVKYSVWKRILKEGTRTAMQSSMLEKSEYQTFILWISKVKKSGKRKVLSM